jgi:uncharacterized metal-binding protein YceD (DUF177 family)
MNSNCTINLNDFAADAVVRLSLDSAFFEQYENPDVLGGMVTAEITLLAAQSTLAICVQGTVRVVCDRCLEEFDCSIAYDGQVHICKAKDANLHNDDDDTIASDDNGFVDLAQYLYESVCLSLPMQRLHPVDSEGHSTCNPKMLAKLKELNCNLE